jgi:hypothetical protein
MALRGPSDKQLALNKWLVLIVYRLIQLILGILNIWLEIYCQIYCKINLINRLHFAWSKLKAKKPKNKFLRRKFNRLKNVEKYIILKLTKL